MDIQEQVSLLAFNTFHFDVKAAQLAVVENEAELATLLRLAEKKSWPLHILGGGSNVLLRNPLNGLVLLNRMKGIEVRNHADSHDLICFQSGEVWQDCVDWSLAHGYSGLENLSWIPGTMGAAPVQNIGAYGVEIKEYIHEIRAVELATGKVNHFSQEACQFGYRDSIFKREAKGRYFITAVTLRLPKHHQPHTSYIPLKELLQKQGLTHPTAQQISEAVIQIRKSKLPDPAVVGNAGSFFKNPEISHETFLQLTSAYPDLPSYPATTGVKIPAAWLIEHCGPAEGISWKGFRDGDAGVHPLQALCLVNFGQADGEAVYQLSARILTSVQQVFNIRLEREVNIW